MRALDTRPVSATYCGTCLTVRTVWTTGRPAWNRQEKGLYARLYAACRSLESTAREPGAPFGHGTPRLVPALCVGSWDTGKGLGTDL